MKKEVKITSGEKVESVYTISPSEFHTRYVNVCLDVHPFERVRISVDVIKKMMKYFVFKTEHLWGYDRFTDIALRIEGFE